MGGLFAHTVKAAAVKAQKEGRKPGWTATLPNKEEMTEIMRLVDEGLRQGALGVGVPVGYMTTGVTRTNCINTRSWRQNTAGLQMDMYASPVFARPPRGH